MVKQAMNKQILSIQMLANFKRAEKLRYDQLLKSHIQITKVQAEKRPMQAAWPFMNLQFFLKT